MRKSIAILLFAVVALSALAALPATQLQAQIIHPSGLAPGSQYQLIFVTADPPIPTNPSGAYYNAFVTSEAALSPTLPTGITWDAVVSCLDGTIANINAPSSGLPIYNTAGLEVTPNGTGLYNTMVPLLENPILYDQFGTPKPHFFAWTGSAPGGGPAPTGLLGNAANIIAGDVGRIDQSSWISDVAVPAGSDGGQILLYALSSAITVPEPATLSLMGLALLAIGAIHFVRRRRRMAR